MKNVFGRGRYANVTSTLALIVALGGTSYAAVKLPSNSVGSKQIKPGAVTGSDIKNNAITSPKVKNDSLTGADINESTLGAVPNATHATSADSATNAGHATSADSATNAGHATSADSAGTVGGVKLLPIQAKLASNAAAATILNQGGLVLTFTCPSGKPLVQATVTAHDGSLIRGTQVSVTTGASAWGSSNQNTGSTALNVFNGPADNRGTSTFTYTYDGGPVVQGTLFLDDSNTYGPFAGCSATGVASATG